MAKERSFWNWIFWGSCCSDRAKNYARKEREESKNKTGEVSKVSESLQEEIENEPGSIFTEVPLDKDSEYNNFLTGEEGGDWYEIR